MGYETQLTGSFRLNKEMSDKLYDFLVKFNQIDHVAVRTKKEYGVEGEFLVDTTALKNMKRIKRQNDPTRIQPSTQPSEFCNWIPTDKKHIKHDGRPKPYFYIEWLVYLIHKILAPNGYIMNGKVKWKGEEKGDVGVISVRNNHVFYSIRNKKEKEMTPQNAERRDGWTNFIKNGIHYTSPVYINNFMRTDVVWKE